MLNRPKVARRTDLTTGTCGCCGGKAVLTVAAEPTPPQGGPVTLCAECIVALARALADVR